MKKNFIKVLFMTVSALLCSQIWAQGSESVSSETTSSESARAYAKTYTISVKKESETIVQTLQLTTRNGRTEITSGMMPADGYSAFFIADDGSYYGFDYDSEKPKGQQGVWIPFTTTEQISYINKITSYLIGKNCQLTTEDENVLDEVSYTEIKESDLLKLGDIRFIRSGKKDFDQLYIYNNVKGKFFLAVKETKDSDKVKIVCFRDKQSKAEIIDNLNETDFKNWLNASKENKETNTHNEEYKKLAKIIYESLKNFNGFKNLYSENFEKYLRVYLQVAMENNKNVYFSELIKNDKNYNPDDYKLDESANEKIVAAAKNYKDITVTERKWYKFFIPETIHLTLNYADNQSDTPDIYKLKYKKQKDNKIPDVGFNKGCDDIGFLNGLLYSSFKEGNLKVKDSNKLSDTYTKYEEAIKALKKNENAVPEMEKVIKSIDDDDLNKISIVIPQLKLVKAGDIIFFSQKLQKHNEGNIGAKKKCAVIMENGSTHNAIEDFQVIILDEEKGAIQDSLKNVWKSQDGYEIPETAEIRRILIVGKASNNNVNWNVLNDKVENKTVEVLCMREDFQTSSEKYRFIPNTGEFLSLEKIRINAFNQLGIRVRGNGWEVSLNGAKDRNWISGNSDGNIYNNSNCKFEIMIGDKIGILSKNQDSNVYSITWNNGAPKSFTIETQDNLLFYGSQPAEIKIRPENCTNARPGDDLLLEFKLTKSGQKDEIITLSEKDYIAVYDKKMVWRANLYIDLSEPKLSGIDWNVAHPWNAPPSQSDSSNTWGETFEYWNVSNWGFNQWNRNYNLTTNSDITNLTNLPVGNGSQVVTLAEYSSYRTSGTNISKTVSYDYNSGSVNAWDSPFDFTFKLNKQKKAIAQHFTSICNQIKQNNSISKEIISTQLNEPGIFPNGSSTISENTVTKQKLSEWDQTVAPNNKWKFYWKEIDQNTSMKPYIPGLGFWGHGDYKYTKTGNPTIDAEIQTMLFPAYLSAGTDCIGFVKRTSYYYDNNYTWSANNKMQYDRAEGSSTPDDVNERTSHPLAYPRTDSVNIISRKDISDTPTYFTKDFSDENVSISEKEYFESQKNKFMSIVPGDIIYYDTAHIGEVKMVDYKSMEEATTFCDLMKSVNIIESGYNGYCFYVYNRNMNQYNSTDNNQSFSTYSWHLASSANNLRNWEIRRLSK